MKRIEFNSTTKGTFVVLNILYILITALYCWALGILIPDLMNRDAALWFIMIPVFLIGLAMIVYFTVFMVRTWNEWGMRVVVTEDGVGIYRKHSGKELLFLPRTDITAYGACAVDSVGLGLYFCGAGMDEVMACYGQHEGWLFRAVDGEKAERLRRNEESRLQLALYCYLMKSGSAGREKIVAVGHADQKCLEQIREMWQTEPIFAANPARLPG